MAGNAKKSYRFLPNHALHTTPTVDDVDFEESDLWASPTRSTHPKKITISSGSRIPATMGAPKASASLPMNVPDWSMMPSEDVKREISDDDEDDVGRRPAPHEYLARQIGRTRPASMSVHEGLGRTLKGRDLRRVRDAVWEKTGFQD